MKYYCNGKFFFINILIDLNWNSFLQWKRWIFSIITPSIRNPDPLEIILKCWFAAQEIFIFIINVENICAAYYFCGNRDKFFLKLKVKKNSIYLK